MESAVQASTKHPSLGMVMRNLRARKGWTLKQMSAECGIPFSTLSKVEHDRLTLTYDKLQQISHRLKISMSDLFMLDGAPVPEPKVMGRRSIGTIEDAFRVKTDNYDYFFLNTELRRKRMVPIITRIRARSLEEFGELVRHEGEEVIYVISGRIVVHTEFYDPVALEEGESIYIDSTMGHAYVTGEGCDEAVVLGVCSSDDENLEGSLMSLHG